MKEFLEEAGMGNIDDRPWFQLTTKKRRLITETVGPVGQNGQAESSFDYSDDVIPIDSGLNSISKLNRGKDKYTSLPVGAQDSSSFRSGLDLLLDSEKKS
jgi:hypothetical protein